MIPQDSIKTVTCPNKPAGWGSRHVVIFLGFWGFAMSYAMRFNLSIAIVAMVKRNASIPSTNASELFSPSTNYSSGYYEEELACPKNPSSKSSFLGLLNGNVYEEEGEFDWDAVQQGIILGSFFWGYMCTQIPGGLLSQRFGGKWTLGLGIFVAAIFALLTPIAARTHVGLLIAVRVIQGFGEGITTPAMHCLLSKWVPPEERGTLASITYSGTSFGTAATMIVSGYLIQANVFGGWPSVFYVIGALSLVWFALWCVFVFDSPAEHPRISGDELYYIQRSIGSQLSKEKLPTPWKKMATSLPLWVIIIAHTGHAWGLYTLLTELPTYMKTILNFDIKQNSWVSALPYAFMCVIGFVIPSIADTFIKRKWLSTLNVRKTCQIIAHITSAVALIGASYSGCNTTVTVILLALAGGINGAAFAGFGVNHIDIASNHAGILMGITNTVANTSGFIAPYVAGVLTNGHATLERWQIVFYITAAVYVVDTLVFLLFASSDEQPWNREGMIVPSVNNNSRENLLSNVEEEIQGSRTVGASGRYEDDFGLGASGIISV